MPGENAMVAVRACRMSSGEPGATDANRSRLSRTTSAIMAVIMRRVIKAPTVVLANLVIGENIIPELLQEDCTPQRLAEAMLAVIADTPERRRQLDAFASLDAIMEIGAASPALRAADIVLDHAPQ